LAVWRSYLACKLSHPGQRKESAESLQSKSHQLILKKGKVSLENHVRERIKHFLQWIFPQKGKRPEQPHQKGKIAAGTAQSHGTVRRSLITAMLLRLRLS